MRTAAQQALRHQPAFHRHTEEVIQNLQRAQRLAKMLTEEIGEDRREGIQNALDEAMDEARRKLAWAGDQHYYATTRK